MRLTVLKYMPEPHNFHVCMVEGENRARNFELQTSGCFPEETTKEEMVGKTIEYEYEHPYISFVEGAKYV